MRFDIPEALKAEHEALHDTLRQATHESGDVGEAARAVAALMHPHFVKEEQFALPPLALLHDLGRGNVTPGMRAVLELTDTLKAELGRMLDDHRRIAVALERLGAAAADAGQPRYVTFAHDLLRHAQMEEEVAYPAALLAGAYVRQRLGGVRPIDRRRPFPAARRADHVACRTPGRRGRDAQAAARPRSLNACSEPYDEVARRATQEGE